MTINGKFLTKFILYFTLAYVGISYMGFGSLPVQLAYLGDLAAGLLALIIFRRLRMGVFMGMPWVKKSIYLAILVMIINVLSGIVGMVSPIWFLRGIRSVCRFYILYIGMIVYWDKMDVYQFFYFMIKLYPLNFAVVFIQWLLWPNNYDGIIGITGTWLTVYMILVVTYYAVMYLRGNEKIWKLAMVSILNFVTAAWGDQKGYYFMFIAAIGIVVLYERKTTKLFTIVIGGAIAIAIGLYIMSIWMPFSYNVLIGSGAIYQYGISTTGGYEISRFGAFNEINSLFFHDSILLNLFGYGLGACEVYSPFYNQYGNLHYTWFTHEWTFLETGYIGIIMLVIFFAWHLDVGAHAKKLIKNNYDGGLISICAAMALVSIITMIYFSLHRSYSGYFIYGVMALIPVLLKENVHEQEE